MKNDFFPIASYEFKGYIQIPWPTFSKTELSCVEDPPKKQDQRHGQEIIERDRDGNMRTMWEIREDRLRAHNPQEVHGNTASRRKRETKMSDMP